MKAVAAVSKFLKAPTPNANFVAPAPSVSEIKEFKDSCSPEEWQEFGRQAAENLGKTFEPA